MFITTLHISNKKLSIDFKSLLKRANESYAHALYVLKIMDLNSLKLNKILIETYNYIFKLLFKDIK